MTSLYLVRHGRPSIDATRPANEWPLAYPWDPALVQLREAGVLPITARWVSSPEPKAHATATVLRGRSVETCAELVEQKRGTQWFDDPAELAATVCRAVMRPAQSADTGWEPAAVTARRVVGAVHALTSQTAGDLVLVGHGTAWTLVVAQLTSSDPDLAAWRAMRMPDVCHLDVSRAAARVRRPWGFVGGGT